MNVETSPGHTGSMNMEDLIANEAAIITISQDDYIKRMPMDTFKEQKRGGQGVTGVQQKREDDVIKAKIWQAINFGFMGYIIQCVKIMRICLNI